MGNFPVYFFGGLLLLLSLMVILSKHPAYAVLYLLGAMFCLSALYAILGAVFVATLQIILYAGAILVMFLFVVMLLTLKEDVDGEGRKLWRTAGYVLGAGLFLSILWIARPELLGGPQISGAQTLGGVQKIGELLFTTYLFPFEMTSFLILAAMIGAIVISKRKMEE